MIVNYRLITIKMNINSARYQKIKRLSNNLREYNFEFYANVRLQTYQQAVLVCCCSKLILTKDILIKIFIKMCYKHKTYSLHLMLLLLNARFIRTALMSH